MDAKTPPIPLKLPEKARAKKQERLPNVSLPPLASNTNYHQRKEKSVNSWSRHAIYPSCYQHHHKNRPYRVLQIGATPLMHACQQADRSRVLRLLKEQEESIGYRDRTLRSALHYCMDAGTGGAVASAAPELVNAADSEGHTPLHLAVIAGDTQLVAVLLANGADVNAKDLEGHSVLHWATVCGEAECVRLILAAGARPSTADLRGGSPLHYAAQCCGAAATAELAVPKKVGLKVLQTLLEFGADVNAKDEDGRQPILWAASAGSVEAVLALARAGGAAAAGASDKDGLTALHCAASRGHVGCIEALVNLCGSQPDHVDDNGCSALHYAATLGHADATALILRLGADPNRQDRKGRTPVLCAAAKGQLETLKILTQHGGSLYARTVRGTGVAHEAVASERIELLKWLAKKRPSTLDVATQDGKTPLHVAALHGYLDACKVLLDYGARINAILRTRQGNMMTALDTALYRGHRDCAKLIQMHGGTTAQRLRIHKTTPNKVFSAKFRIKRTENSTDTESSPQRRNDYGNRAPPRVYYEERWIKKRIHKRGNSKKFLRRDSRSFSEEEVRSSKASFREERQRRSRSESARYDHDSKYEDDYTEEKWMQKGRKKRITRSKNNYGESSVGYSDESSQEDMEDDGTEKTYLWRKLEKRRSKCRAYKDKRADVEIGDREYLRSEMKNVNHEHSCSDDSLEVIVVKTSVEKTREKVVSGEKLKTPKELDSTVHSHKRTTRRRKSKSPSSMAASDKENLATRSRMSNDVRSLKKEREEDGNAVMEVGAPFVGSQYYRDATDSTSHETVERVLVTAMVHKDQGPDTPKLTRKISKEVAVFDDISEKEITVPNDSIKIEDVYERSNESSSANSSLSKAAKNSKKNVANMRLGTRDLENEHGLALNNGEETKGTEEVDEEGRLYTVQVKESTKTSWDSQERQGSSQDQNPPVTVTDEGVEYPKDSFSSKNIDDVRERSDASSVVLEKVAITALNGGSIFNTNLLIDKFVQSSEREIPTSPLEKAISQVETKEGEQAAEELVNSEGIKKKRNEDETSVENDVTLVALAEKVMEESADGRESVIDEVELANKERLEASGITTKASSPFFTARVCNEFFEDKEQVDFARGKSVDLSSDSRDSVLMREGEDDVSRIDNPVSTTREISEIKSTEHKARRRSNSVVIVKTDTTTKFFMNDGRTLSSKGERTSNSSPRRPKQSGCCSNQGASVKMMDGVEKGASASLKSLNKNKRLFEKSGERLLDRSAIIAVIESPKWEEEDEEVEKEIRKVIGEDVERDTEPEESNEVGVTRILPSTSEEESSRRDTRTFGAITLPEVRDRSCLHSKKIHSPLGDQRLRLRTKYRRDSGGRDSGIEPSPRVSRIPRRRSTLNDPNTEKHQELNIDTITRDVQISLRRYHLERKIFFQLMELKRLQIRHGRANEQVLVKRQVESFHKAGMSGPTLGVAKYDQPLTFRHFEAFLYEQLRKLQRRPATPNFCTDAKYCTQRTHRCHHATTAYTSVPVYTYCGDAQERADLFPKIEARGRGQMTVEVTHGDEKQVIALPAERLDSTKRYFVTFTVRGESQGTTKPKSSHSTKRSAESV
ncbi:hypothetical protein KPH14_011177 [Odynerus spinipes]|uniref:Uncharacterized protein n=1 Tax=Odynerus spinipes TaxID=1348599 RepID=A0AAD9R9C1_9HYME|nr:hypothetical protein KPH14_011177 [Odynerus spinipes]